MVALVPFPVQDSVQSAQVDVLELDAHGGTDVDLNGQPAVRPMMVLTLSCDHRVVDGARAAQFLDDLVNLIVDPWRLLV